MHRLAFVVYLCSACRSAVLVLQYDSLNSSLHVRLGIGIADRRALGTKLSRVLSNAIIRVLVCR